MLTAKNRITDLVQGFESGANDYLIKPFSRNELNARVQNHLKLGEAYQTLRQNLSLRKELEQRKQTEQDLQITQRRLAEILNRVDSAVLAVNESDEISFCNQTCERIFGWEAGSLLGQPIQTVLHPDEEGFFRQMKESLDRDGNRSGELNYRKTRFRNPDRNTLTVETALTLLDFNEERLNLLIMKKRTAFRKIRRTGTTGVPIMEAVKIMDQNRLRLHSLEVALDQSLPKAMARDLQVMDELKAVDTTLEKLGQTLIKVEQIDNKRKMTVELMNLALEYRREATGATKAEMASRSGIWRVYTNKDGWERTQTLDRYLTLEKLPQIPRWKKVIETAEFVLADCRKKGPMRHRLEKLLFQYQNMD